MDRLFSIIGSWLMDERVNDEEEDDDDVVLLERCATCQQLIPLRQFPAHLRVCAAAARSRQNRERAAAVNRTSILPASEPVTSRRRASTRTGISSAPSSVAGGVGTTQRVTCQTCGQRIPRSEAADHRLAHDLGGQHDDGTVPHPSSGPRSSGFSFAISFGSGGTSYMFGSDSGAEDFTVGGRGRLQAQEMTRAALSLAASMTNRDSDSEEASGGMDAAMIRSLPEQPFDSSRRSQLSDESRQCLICLDEFHEGERQRWLPCLHTFHTGCVDRWLSSNASCPICKIDIERALLRGAMADDSDAAEDASSASGRRTRLRSRNR